MSNTYFHLTTQENLKTILQDGLIPQIGPNSAMVKEKKPLVCLCKEEDLPYWQILLDRPVCVKVTKLPNPLEKFSYTLYSEYLSYDKIPANCIEKIPLEPPSPDVMKELCLFYIDQLSIFSIACARYYVNQPDDTALTNLTQQADTLLAILPRLDFSVFDKTEVRNYLIEEGESGEYTLCDEFVGSNCKLYEKLIQYPEDTLTEKRQKVYKYITDNLSGCLTVHTGGWVPEDHVRSNNTHGFSL